MKNLLKKIKKPTFWLSLGGAVTMCVQLLGVKVDAPYVNELISAVCSVFVILGIMDQPESGSLAEHSLENNTSAEDVEKPSLQSEQEETGSLEKKVSDEDEEVTSEEKVEVGAEESDGAEKNFAEKVNFSAK